MPAGRKKKKSRAGYSAHVEGGDGAGGVAADELHVHAEVAEEVGAPRLEPRAGGLVEVELHLPPAVDVVDVVRRPRRHVVPLERHVHRLPRRRRRRTRRRQRRHRRRHRGHHQPPRGRHRLPPALSLSLAWPQTRYSTPSGTLG